MNAMKAALAKKMLELKQSHPMNDDEAKDGAHDQLAGPAPELDKHPGAEDDEQEEMAKFKDIGTHMQGMEADMKGLNDMHKGMDEGSDDHMKILAALGDHKGAKGLEGAVALKANDKMAALQAMKKKKGY